MTVHLFRPPALDKWGLIYVIVTCSPKFAFCVYLWFLLRELDLQVPKSSSLSIYLWIGLDFYSLLLHESIIALFVLNFVTLEVEEILM